MLPEGRAGAPRRRADSALVPQVRATDASAEAAGRGAPIGCWFAAARAVPARRRVPGRAGRSADRGAPARPCSWAMRARAAASSCWSAAMSRSRSASRPPGRGARRARRSGPAVIALGGGRRPARVAPVRAGLLGGVGGGAQRGVLGVGAFGGAAGGGAERGPQRRPVVGPAGELREPAGVGGQVGRCGRHLSAQSVSCSPAWATAARRSPSRPGPSSTIRAAAWAASRSLSQRREQPSRIRSASRRDRSPAGIGPLLRVRSRATAACRRSASRPASRSAWPASSATIWRRRSRIGWRGRGGPGSAARPSTPGAAPPAPPRAGGVGVAGGLGGGELRRRGRGRGRRGRGRTRRSTARAPRPGRRRPGGRCWRCGRGSSRRRPTPPRCARRSPRARR